MQEKAQAPAAPSRKKLVLQAETEKERDVWVELLRRAVARRRCVREALSVAAERLEANSNEWGSFLSLPAILEEVVRRERERASLRARETSSREDDHAPPAAAAPPPAAAAAAAAASGGGGKQQQRVQFDCTDLDLAGLVGPLKRNAVVTGLDLSCLGGGGCGALTDEAASALGQVLQLRLVSSRDVGAQQRCSH
jgi:hypothetical protein